MISSHVDTSMMTLQKSHWKTPNLEGTYLEFCNFVWPLLCTIWKVSKLEKISRRIQSLKIPRSTEIWAYLTYSRLGLHGTHVFHLCTREFPSMLPTNTQNYYFIHDFYASKPVNPFVFTTLINATRNYHFAFVIVFIVTREYVLYISKMDFSQILGSLGGYTTNSFGCN